MRTHISDGNNKLGKTPNVSLSPCKACNHDCACRRGDCYALKAFRMYKTARQAWDENLALCKTPIGRARYFIDICQYLRRKQPAFFRWHVAGDILDQQYLNSMRSIARDFPKTRFLAFTKMHQLDFRGLPSNLTIVFSMWPDWGNTRKRLPRAWMRDPKQPDQRIPDNALECPGNCETCGMCWNLPILECDVVFDKH